MNAVGRAMPSVRPCITVPAPVPSRPPRRWWLIWSMSRACLRPIRVIAYRIWRFSRMRCPIFHPVDGRHETAYYLRLLALDRPGVLADITRILGNLGISIEAIIQKEAAPEETRVPIIC